MACISLFPQSASYADTGTVQTGGYTSSSMDRSSDEDDEEGELVLPDYDASQAYLSLGLTPLSQLSPDAHTSNDFGFFPSMPPPVAPSNSIFSTGSGSNLAIDNPFSLHSGAQSNGSLIDSSVMPDAYPERRTRRSKYDNNPLSQGFPKLEPVIEQSPPVTGSEFSCKQSGFSSSVESSERSPRDQEHFLFPSAVPTPEFSRLSQGRTAMRKRPGMKGGSREKLNLTSPRGKNMPGGYGSMGISRYVDTNKPMLSPRQETKRKRQQAREVEIAKQKEELRKKIEQEESERQWQQEQRKARAAREYHHSRDGSDPHYPSMSSPNALNSHEMTNGHGDMNTVRDAAAMQRIKRGSHSHQASSTSIGSSSQGEESPHKWTPRHSHHSSLEETPMGDSHRPERSDSTHVYTTYEHRTLM